MELKIGQDAYYVNQEKIFVVKIVAIIRKETQNGEIIKYEIQDYNGKNREVSQAYLVSDFDLAKKIANANWDEIVQRVTAQVRNQPKYTFQQAREMYENAKKKALKEKQERLKNNGR